MVRVVVVNFDGGAVTLRCLDALLASHRADLLEIVVVDNASVDGVLWTLREKYPQVRLIVSDTNEGFARGCNLALVQTTPGSASQRNVARCGFQLAYTKVTMMRPVPG